MELGIAPKNVILSIKPEYAMAIIAGKKTVELRRKFPDSDITGGVVVIYASSPMKQIIGYAHIKGVERLTVSQIWRRFNKQACVSKDFFDLYFEDREEGYAIALEDPVELDTPLPLDMLASEYSFSVPQSFCYASPSILRALEHAGT